MSFDLSALEVTDYTIEDLKYHEDDVIIPYKGNPNVKAAGSSIVITPERGLELAKCAADPVYFCQNYLKIITLDHGLQPFVPRPYQERAIETMLENRFTIIKQGRQSGKTATTAAVMMWLMLFNKEYAIACLAHKQDQAIEIIDRIKIYFESMPLWMQPNVVAWNRKSIRLSSKTKVFAAATGSGSVRGQTLNFVFCDEFAIVPNNIAEEFYTGTFPTISSGTDTKFVIASTPKGFNLFYKIWKEAEENANGFVPFSINWWDVPGRDEAWRKAEIARTSEAMFDQEYATEFLGSSATLVTGKKLLSLVMKEPIGMDESKNKLFIFEAPIPGHRYVLVADVSEGVGGDSSAFVVLDVTQTPFKVVCTFNDEWCDPLDYPNIIFDSAHYYNEAFVAIENNSIGQGVVNQLYMDLEYTNVFSTDTKTKKDNEDIMEGGRQRLGIRQTANTRRRGNSTLKSLVENDQLFIEDQRIFSQMTRYVRKNGKFQATDGAHDDLVMCLVIFSYLTTLKNFKEIVGIDILTALNQKRLDSQHHLPPDIVIDSGIMMPDIIMDFAGVSEFDAWLMS